MVFELNFSKIVKPKKSKIAKKISADFFEIFLAASGRILVRATFSSNLTSNKSLITQPAERIIIDPAKNKKIMRRISSVEIAGKFLSAKKIPQRQGKKSNQIPVG
jgi:hypothetical protein